MLRTKGKIKSIKEDTVEVIGSTEVVDRHGEIVKQDGWKLKNFLKNPVILWGHNVREQRPPIGKAEKVWVDKSGESPALKFKVKFDMKDSFATEVFRKIKEGFINTTSVGFRPLDKEDNTYTKQELMELSFVPVPANPDARVTLRDAGMETTTWKKIAKLDKKQMEKALKEDVKKSPPCRQAGEDKDECVERKIPEIMGENPDMEQDQAIAIAHEMCSSLCTENQEKKQKDKKKVESKKRTMKEKEEKTNDEILMEVLKALNSATNRALRIINQQNSKGGDNE